jgi:arylamine N-acetyltransferase
MPHAEALAPALLERVLAKLGLSEPPSPTLEGLRTLYPAWCRTVPFDNIRQLIHRRSQDPSRLCTKSVPWQCFLGAK